MAASLMVEVRIKLTVIPPRSWAGTWNMIYDIILYLHGEPLIVLLWVVCRQA